MMKTFAKVALSAAVASVSMTVAGQALEEHRCAGEEVLQAKLSQRVAGRRVASEDRRQRRGDCFHSQPWKWSRAG